MHCHSVFAREYSQSSGKCITNRNVDTNKVIQSLLTFLFFFPANPCPFGPAPNLLNFMSVEELQAMEEELWDDLREANEQLLAARAYAVEGNDDDEEAGLITTGVEAQDSRDGEDEDSNLVEEEQSEAIKIPDATVQAFCSEGLRNRYVGTSLKNQWGKFCEHRCWDFRSCLSCKYHHVSHKFHPFSIL